MKGKYVVIVLMLVVVAVVAAIYFSMMAQFKKDESSYERMTSIQWVQLDDEKGSIKKA